jgi:Skp family chaperone for outer membrane proteins
MKLTKRITAALVIAVLFIGAYQVGTLDAPSAAAPAKIGVINVTDVLENSQKHRDWQAKMQKERGQMENEFAKMKAEMEAMQANLKILSPGSADYLKTQSDLLEKKAIMQAKDDFYRSKVEAEMQQWTESLYQKLLAVVEQVARQKGLDMVIADESLDLPAPSLRDFMLTIKTKKMLYHHPNYDITTAVQEALDKAD